MNLRNLHDEAKYIATSTLYMYGANGDHQLMAALCLFMSLNQQLDFGNYSICKLDKLKANNNQKNESIDYLQLLHIQQALLCYSACFDTILQIIYFATHISSDFRTETEYAQELRKVTITRIKNALQKQNESELVPIIEKYYETKRKPIAETINSFKHRGGISLPTLNNYIPEIAHCPHVSLTKSSSGRFTCKTPEKLIVMKASWFYPLTKSLTEYLSLLHEANDIIVNFSIEVLDCLGITREKVNLKDFSPRITFKTLDK